VLERRVLMVPLVGETHGPVECSLQGL
jgi:hypothetical protein